MPAGWRAVPYAARASKPFPVMVALVATIHVFVTERLGSAGKKRRARSE
jgi:hypothetical protein